VIKQFGLSAAFRILVIVSALLLPAAARVAGQVPGHSPDVGFEPTTLAVADAMLKLARVTPEDVVYDLGSGDGRIVNLAAQKYGARGVGVELEPALIVKSQQAAVAAHVADRATFIQGDLFEADISRATVVTLYLWPSVNRRLEAKLRHELRPGTRIVSNSFGIGNWTPDETVRTEDGTQVFLWIVPRPAAHTPDVDFIATPETVVDDMLQLARVKSTDVVYDLGSGDGRIPILAAQKYGARGVGIEIDPRLVEIARQVARDGEIVAKVTFIEDDLFTADISEATVVTLALSPAVNVKLEARLRRDLRPGTRIVSHEFPIGDWVPDARVRALDGTTLYLFTVPQR
jgi:predicted RNA methylase